jgi:hypothetical protein
MMISAGGLNCAGERGCCEQSRRGTNKSTGRHRPGGEVGSCGSDLRFTGEIFMIALNISNIPIRLEQAVQPVREAGGHG